MRPVIGITADNRDNTAASGRYESPLTYSRAVARAGGVPVILPHAADLAGEYVQRLDGLVLTGGVDPRTEAFGEPTHPRARPIDPARQAFELALLDVAERRPDLPVLGVCLGMQLMALFHGGRLHQYLPDVLEKPEAHQHDARHNITLHAEGTALGVTAAQAGALEVVSYHQQAVADAGRLRVAATAADGVIEAIDAPGRPFYLGVQWHPERGGDDALSLGLYRRLVGACPRTRA